MLAIISGKKAKIFFQKAGLNDKRL